jgi:DNA-binding NarL/FixJ family response regulator
LLASEVDELLGPETPPEMARRLYEESGGNPFYLEQLAHSSGSDRGDHIEPSSAQRAGGSDLPSAVAAALASELAGLTSDARVFLDAAAVIGDPFELDFTTATAEMEEPQALVALDVVLEAGLVHRTDVPRRFRFRHPILRRATYDAIGSAWKHAAHERAARALAAHGEPAAGRAHHVDEFAALGDRDAIRLFREAADASAERAPESAARWYRAALRLLPRDPQDADERAEVMAQLAGVLAGIGHLDESRASLLELLALVPAEMSARRARVTATCAGLEHLLGHHDEAHARLMDALDQLQEDSAEGAALMLDLAMDAYYTPDYEQMHQWGARSLEVARGLGDRPLTAAANAVICLGDAYGGSAASAEAHRAEAGQIVDSLDDDELAARLDAIANLGNAEIYLGRYSDAARHLSRGLALGRASGQGQLFPLLTQGLGFTLTVIGRLDEARDQLDGTLEAARLVGSSQSVSWALLNCAWATMLTGDLETALRQAKASAASAHEVDANPITIWSTCVLGAILIEAGQPARGVEMIREGTGGPELAAIPGFFRVTIQERVTDALLTLGRHEEADQAASYAEDYALAIGLALGRAQAARARAAVLLATGDSRSAATRALEGAGAADKVDARIDAARCRTLAGRALHAAGECERATEVLTAAAETLDKCGAIRYRDEAERELRRLGRRDHRRRGGGRADGEGLAALTTRELEVARLVVDRKTNPEIAAELFLSQKTIETHLRNAFRKLNVSSRVELARAVERADRPT